MSLELLVFNVSDLSLFLVDDGVQRPEPFQGGENDEAIQIEVSIVRRGLTTRSGAKAIREGFSKAVQQILDQDGQTGQNQLVIEEIIQLKIQDQAGPIEFRSFGQNRTGQIISTCDLGSDPFPIQSGSE